MSVIEFPIDEQLAVFLELMRGGDVLGEARTRGLLAANSADAPAEAAETRPAPREVSVDGADDADQEPARSSYPRCSDGNGTLTHLFFSDDEFDLARAKAICGKCGLAAACLDGALQRVEPYGVWGGKLVIDGVIVEVKRGRGRPPKNPRSPLVVDEVPVPPHLVA